MRDRIVLPDLHMLPAEALIPHEDCDPRRVEKLRLRIEEEHYLKNPPVVACIPGSDRFVVLDCASRRKAFAFLGIPNQTVNINTPFAGAARQLGLGVYARLVAGVADGACGCQHFLR